MMAERDNESLPAEAADALAANATQDEFILPDDACGACGQGWNEQDQDTYRDHFNHFFLIGFPAIQITTNLLWAMIWL